VIASRSWVIFRPKSEYSYEKVSRCPAHILRSTCRLLLKIIFFGTFKNYLWLFYWSYMKVHHDSDWFSNRSNWKGFDRLIRHYVSLSICSWFTAENYSRKSKKGHILSQAFMAFIREECQKRKAQCRSVISSSLFVTIIEQVITEQQLTGKPVSLVTLKSLFVELRCHINNITLE